MRYIHKVIESTVPPVETNVLWLNKGIARYFTKGKWVIIGDSEDKQELEEKVDSLDKEMGEVKNDLAKFGQSQGVVELQIGDSTEVKAANLKVLQSVQSTDHTFLADIDYGYGTGQWLPTTGGKATIFTSAGHMVTYSISKEGAVAKTSEGGVSRTINSFSLKQSRFTGSNGNTQATLTEAEKTIFQEGVDMIILTSNSDKPMFYAYKYLGEGIGANVWATSIVTNANTNETYITIITLIGGNLQLEEAVVISKATTTSFGTVKQVAAPASLTTSAESAEIIAGVNSIITSLVSSGVFKGA